MHFEQPVEQDSCTRARVLAAVSEHGPITARRIGALLGLTAAAVRRHLDALASAVAIIERKPHPTGTARGRGRPAREWVLAPAGHEALMSDYDHLAAQALHYLRQALGPEAVSSFARTRVADFEARYAAELASAGSDPVLRAEALVAILNRDGYAATTRPIGFGALSGVQICQGHCPVKHVAEQFPELCHAETEAFSRLLGVHVQRLSTLASGQHVCTTFVPSAAPSSAAAAR
ncbi:MAG: transcriptional regulator [Actinomycetales bacterium]|nr:MAG: transcriptional regulator [Actinomycetales bacterium]